MAIILIFISLSMTWQGTKHKTTPLLFTRLQEQNDLNLKPVGQKKQQEAPLGG
jgi:hypothetical protein